VSPLVGRNGRPPKSRAGRRIVGIPAAIVRDLERHLAVYTKPGPGALVFPGVMGGPGCPRPPNGPGAPFRP
jgi:hypothetical protein